MSERIEIRNRKDQRIVGLLEKPPGRTVRGTAIVQHGHSGTKEQAHIVRFGEVFRDAGFQTFIFDTTNSFGESDGTFEEARLGLHYEDLEDVVLWAQKQTWYCAPLALCGHSMGGYAVVRYTEDHPGDVSLLLPLAPVVSGALLHETKSAEELHEWKKEGWRVRESSTRPGLMQRSPWALMEEYLLHDLLPKADKVTCPTFLVTGSNDDSCPPKHIHMLYDRISSNDKVFHVIPNELHTYSATGRELIAEKIKGWLDRH